MRPLPLLFCGYGLAGLGAAALWVSGVAGPPVALATFWLGGAVATLGLGVAPVTRRRFSAPQAEAAPTEQDASDRALAEALRRWEADRRDDAAQASSARSA